MHFFIPRVLTAEVIRGYIPSAAEKSAVGIGVPGMDFTHTALSGFFMR